MITKVARKLAHPYLVTFYFFKLIKLNYSNILNKN